MYCISLNLVWEEGERDTVSLPPSFLVAMHHFPYVPNMVIPFPLAFPTASRGWSPSLQYPRTMGLSASYLLSAYQKSWLVNFSIVHPGYKVYGFGKREDLISQHFYLCNLLQMGPIKLSPYNRDILQSELRKWSFVMLMMSDYQAV